MNHKKRRKKLKRFIFLLLAFIFIWYFNNFTLKTTVVNIETKKINDEITIVHITDLHGASFGDGNSRLIKKIESASPDLICVTGDLYTNLASKSNGESVALELLSQLAKKYKLCYTNGEHDDNQQFFDKLMAVGVTVMGYKEQTITIKSSKLHIYGIDNVYFPSGFDLNNAFEPDNDNFTILLSHSNWFKKFADFGVDLTLCGDTHGGIFRLPYIGALADDGGFLPDLNGRYTKGLYSLNGNQMFISSGLGNYPIPARFFNRPEVAVIKLIPKQ